MRSVTVSVPGTPVAKGRPRLGRGYTYTDDKTRVAETALAWRFKDACDEPLEGPLIVLLAFSFEPPERWRKAQKQAVADGARPPHPIKPDLDNLTKLVLDAGNGTLWNDDAQIVSLAAHKSYAAEAETWLTVFSANEYGGE